MLSINWSDVMSVLNLCVPYLIGFTVVAIIAIIVMILCKKAAKIKKRLICGQTVLVVFLAFVCTVNMICFGPLSTIISLATGEGSVSEQTTEKALEFGVTVGEEGMVLLKNDSSLLPLNNRKLNVFGWASTNPCYGGTGSGGMSGEYSVVSLLEGIQSAGIETNEALSQFYTDYCDSRPLLDMFEQDFTLPEPTVDSYSESMLEDAKSFSDTALIVISRVGGEHYDLPKEMGDVNYTDNSTEYQDFAADEHILQLSSTEQDMVSMVCDNFDNVIVLCNSANVMEMGFANDYSQIKSVLWFAGAGQNGFAALGNVLTGAANPSGKTADTFVYNLETIPSWNNFGSFTYTNMDEFQISESDEFIPNALPTFVNYNEGIYVGYRFFETASDEGLIDYDTTVQYPFGYGLSYTSFSQKMGDLQTSDGEISVDVTVTNTGDVAGKDVVEVYYNPPYTNGGIEKSSVNLVAFDKTDELKPGDTQTLTITFSQEDMASYDSAKSEYIVEQGEYIISINSDSHNVIDQRTYTVDSDVEYNQNNTHNGDVQAASNQLQDIEGNVTYLSRQNGFANYEDAVAAPTNYEMDDVSKASFVNNAYFDLSAYSNSSDEMPTTGASKTMSLEQLSGVDYDDTRWDTLLDQLTIDDMNMLIALGGYQTAALSSIDKADTVDCDGPTIIYNNFTSKGSVTLPCSVILANTWNEDIALEYGRMMGIMADELNVSGWYAPAVNIHRNPLSGRNNEYFSEDLVLSGKIAAQDVKGAAEYGVYAYVKHFALNEQETNRWSMLCTWSTEQAAREIYLKPFEYTVKDGGTTAIMSSYNYLGTTWAGADDRLLNTILRDEWGFKGMVISDYFGNFGYMQGERAILNGNDMCLVPYDVGSNYIIDTNNATVVKAMRTASKNILYTVVNSRSYDPSNISVGMLAWKKTAIVIDVMLGLLFVGLEVMVLHRYRREKESVNNIYNKSNQE